MMSGVAKQMVQKIASTPRRRRQISFVYGCGFGRTGSLFTRALANGTVKDYWKPRQILYFNSRNIERIAAGFGFSVFAAGKRLYGGGLDIFSNEIESNDHNFWRTGICLNANNNSNSKSEIGRITGLAAGRRHFLVATANAVYAFGDNAHGQCGCDPEKNPLVRFDQSLPNKIPLPSDSKVAQVHCTLDTSFIVLESGQVLSFGLGTDGQLGRGVCAFDWRCQPVTGQLQNVAVRSLKGSTDTLMAITHSGQLFMWGQNEYGQMHPFVDDIQTGFPCEIRFALGKLIAADSTATSCIALTDQGQVYVWGFGVLGQGPNVTSIRRPTLLDPNLFSGSPNDDGKVEQIRAGNLSMFAISKLENIFSWGVNRYSHLGLAHDKDQYFPFQVSILKKPLDISVGPDHTLFLMR